MWKTGVYEELYDESYKKLIEIVNRYYDTLVCLKSIHSFLNEVLNIEAYFISGCGYPKDMVVLAIKSALYAIGKEKDCMSFWDVYSCYSMGLKDFSRIKR